MALLTLAMKYKTILNSIKDFLVRLTDVLVPVVSVALLLGIIFGPEAPFVGDVYKNISDLLNLLGSDGLLGLVAIIIILAYLKK
jgi:hypothetical protein|tara:strand:- start:17 stop:268 length:252 start_codon:yes stop_codon:yes gene_type:complete